MDCAGETYGDFDHQPVGRDLGKIFRERKNLPHSFFPQKKQVRAHGSGKCPRSSFKKPNTVPLCQFKIRTGIDHSSEEEDKEAKAEEEEEDDDDDDDYKDDDYYETMTTTRRETTTTRRVVSSSSTPTTPASSCEEEEEEVMMVLSSTRVKAKKGGSTPTTPAAVPAVAVKKHKQRKPYCYNIPPEDCCERCGYQELKQSYNRSKFNGDVLVCNRCKGRDVVASKNQLMHPMMSCCLKPGYVPPKKVR